MGLSTAIASGGFRLAALGPQTAKRVPATACRSRIKHCKHHRLTPPFADPPEVPAVPAQATTRRAGDPAQDVAPATPSPRSQRANYRPVLAVLSGLMAALTSQWLKPRVVRMTVRAVPVMYCCCCGPGVPVVFPLLTRPPRPAPFRKVPDPVPDSAGGESFAARRRHARDRPVRHFRNSFRNDFPHERQHELQCPAARPGRQAQQGAQSHHDREMPRAAGRGDRDRPGRVRPHDQRFRGRGPSWPPRAGAAAGRRGGPATWRCCRRQAAASRWARRRWSSSST